MKQNINYSKLSVFGCLFVAVGLFFSSCIKNYEPNETNFSGLTPTVLIPEGGLSTFPTQALTFPSSDSVDTAKFHLNYAATNVAPTDETITIGVDPTALASYNALGGIQYQAFPDSIFSFTTTSVTVKKGDNYSDAIGLAVYPYKIDPTQNYMLPISIMTVPAGATISANYKTIYYHLIGNPIAGAYEEYWSRWNATDTTSGAAGALYYQLDVGTVILAPNSPTEVQVTSEGVGEYDIIDFTNTAGVLSNFQVSIPSSDAARLALTSIGTPVFVTADPVNGIYEIYFGYVNGGGAARVIVNKYVKL